MSTPARAPYGSSVMWSLRRGETLYTLTWKRKVPLVDYCVLDAYDDHELYVTSDQKDAFAARKRITRERKRPVKLVALLYGRLYQAVFRTALWPATRPALWPAPRRDVRRATERCIGWRRLEDRKVKS